MSQSKLLITGASPRGPPDVHAPPRLEIATFVKDVKQFSLYIQALQALYDKPQTETASYYQIAGIHGLPYVDWNQSPSGTRGYCVHGTDLFPTWHRPYVVLFEQEVQRLAQGIASTYESERPAWQAAAASLRQPFWGWDEFETLVPPCEVTCMQTVDIITPNGARKNMLNPFWTYRFPSGPAHLPFPSNLQGSTTRHPNENRETNVHRLQTTLKAMGAQVINNTRRLYSITNWKDFVLGSRSTSGLDSIHGTIHVRVGGGGHMSYVSVAAFDPIFYLHHAQVDRVIDLWYKRHRDWPVDRKNLTPFWNTPDTYWESPNIIDTNTTFNYSFKQLSPSAEASQSSVQVDEWSARVSCEQFELGGSFSVFVFLGDVPADPDQWLTDPTLAGTFDAFVNDAPNECANCREHADLVMRGFVHLNDKFLELSGQESLNDGVVVPYLKEHLNWSIQKANGEVVGVDALPSLQVTVLVTPLTMPVGAEIPIEGEPIYYNDITSGRPGGYTPS